MAKPRFVGRREYFGSLFYDFQRQDYIPFDWDATYIFENSSDGNVDEIAERIKNRVSRESFLTFLQLCQSIELFDNDFRMTGEFLPFSPVKGLLSAPLKVHLQLTNECSLNCRHCSQNTREPLKNQLSIQEIYKIIDEMASTGVFELVIGGGDPFLREKDLLKTVEYASQKRIAVSISTTGLFVGRIMIKKLSEYPIKGIRVSFDGSTEKSCDYQRGKGAYRRMIRSVKILREILECPITLHSVLMKTNFTEILSLLKMVQKLKCDSWSVDFVRPVGSAKINKNIMMSPEEIRESLKSIRKLQQYSSTPIHLRHFPYQTHGKRVYRGFGCAGGNLNCWIDAAGNVYPCSFLSENFNSGNIREHSLKDIWLYSANLQLMRNRAGNPVCKECSSADSCRGGCRARAIGTGDLDSIDPACIFKIE